MNLPKLFVAIGIAFILTSFLSSTLITFYKPPKIDLSQCSSLRFGDNCEDIIEQQCGKYPTDYNGLRSIYYKCQSQVYSSSEYQDCTKNSQSSYESCIVKEKSKFETYQIIFYLILVITGIIIITLGFLLISEESIGAGLIGGGALTVFFSYLYSLLASFVSSFTSALTGVLSGYVGFNPELTGAVVSETATKTPAISYLNIIFLFITLIILILFAHFRLEKKDEK